MRVPDKASIMPSNIVVVLRSIGPPGLHSGALQRLKGIRMHLGSLGTAFEGALKGFLKTFKKAFQRLLEGLPKAFLRPLQSLSF